MPEYDVEKTRKFVVKSIRSIRVALQMYKNPNISLEGRVESCSMHSVVAWESLLHAYYTRNEICCEDNGGKYWGLSRCINSEKCPLSSEDKKDLEELLTIRHTSVHSFLDEVTEDKHRILNACFAMFDYYRYKLLGYEYYNLDESVVSTSTITPLHIECKDDFKNSPTVNSGAYMSVIRLADNLQGDTKIAVVLSLNTRKESTITPMHFDLRDKERLHRYILFSYRNSFLFGNKVFNHGNIGDNMQTIATKRAILKIDKQADFVTIQRDQLISYQNKLPAICVMQGWFEHTDKGLDFWPGKSVIPVWLGTHWYRYTCGRLRFNPDRLRDVVEVGCRDKATLEFCKKQGIPAYFSRCLTLTFERRKVEPKSPKIFVVTTHKCFNEFRSFLPQDIERDAIPLQQQNLPLGTEPGPYEEKAEELLARYRDEAGLVITTALRCALPCIAMGIPTVFVRTPNIFDPDRISGTEDIIPIWTYEDLQRGKVDFSPKVPNIEPLKGWMIENLDLSIRKAKGIPVDEDHLREVRQKIENFSAI